jgi:hypothetical protein
LTDVYGNSIYYLDKNSEIFETSIGFVPEDEPYEVVSLKASTYYVGLENKRTGTFASNSTMDKTSRLNVDDLKENADAFGKLNEKGYNVKGFYNVKVKGKCDMKKESTKVFFEAPEGFENGDTLRIRHLLSNGTVQTTNGKVRKGKVCIDVKEFSPFMIEVKKSNDKNLFTKKGIIYQATGKKTVKVIGTSKKKVKSIAIPATVKTCGKKYTVIGVGKEAFKNCKKLKKVTFGKNVKKIEKNAFYNCKKLKTLIFKTKKLKYKNVGKNAFKGISKNVKIKAPKGKQESYLKFVKE